MKNKTCIGTLVLLALLMISSMAVATTTYTSSDRALVTVVSGNMQHQDVIPGALSYDNNVTLPWMISDFNQTLTQITWHFTGPCRMTGGFWNERVFGATNYTTDQWVNETLWLSLNEGGGNNMTATDTWSHINMTFNNTDWEAWTTYYLDDLTDINGRISTITEQDKATPDVGDHWSVSDTMVLGTMPFAMDISLLLKYPTTAVKTGNFYWNDTVNTGDNGTFVFQKNGPAVKVANLNVTGTAGDVTVKFPAKDKLHDATWTITFADDVWNGLFTNVDNASLVVKMNGDTVSKDDIVVTADSISLDKIDVSKGTAEDKNTLTLTWTIPAPIAPGPAEQPVWYLQSVSGFPIWLIGAVIAIIAVVLLMASKGKK